MNKFHEYNDNFYYEKIFISSWWSFEKTQINCDIDGELMKKKIK